MRSPKVLPYLLAGLLCSSQGWAQTQAIKERLGEYIPGFDYDFSMRFRHEGVSQDNALEDAAASTVRTRLTLNASPSSSLMALVEIDNVSAVASDHYDSFVNNRYRGSHSVIADPVGTELNQAQISYSIAEGEKISVGRQRIVHAGQRFVGGVAWRQNEQTYDAASYQKRSSSLDLDYSYVWNVNRIFAGTEPSVQITDFDSDSHFLRANYKQDWGSINGFTYALDFSNAPALSSLTYGIGYSGNLGPLAVNASIAKQSDYAGNPVSYDADYLALDAAMDVGKVRVLLGYELLGSDQGIASFRTPLATLHIFQGWTDLFLNTPNNGIEDRYLTLSGNIAGLSLSATYHDLKSDRGAVDFGSEVDLLANYPINTFLSSQLKFATYSSDAHAVDTEKLWFTLNLSF